MLEIILEFKINGREVPCDAFIDAVKLTFVEVVKAATQQRPAKPSNREIPLQSLPSGPPAFSVIEAAELLRVSKAAMSCRRYTN